MIWNEKNNKPLLKNQNIRSKRKSLTVVDLWMTSRAVHRLFSLPGNFWHALPTDKDGVKFAAKLFFIEKIRISKLFKTAKNGKFAILKKYIKNFKNKKY